MAAALTGVCVPAAAAGGEPLLRTRTVLLAAVLFVPSVVSSSTLGLQVTWSSGLTLPNFVIPALALPLLALAWWSGCDRSLFPARWPALAAGMLVLLGWSLLTLVPAWLRQSTAGLAGLPTILAHAAKLALFILLGVVFAGGGAAWLRRAAKLLLAAMAVNAVIGLAQAAHLVLALSPLAQGQVPRATGLFYDANFYAVTCVWALLWLLCQHSPQNAWRWPAWALVLALAGNIVVADSRAGYAALAAGMAILWWSGHRRAVGRAAVLLAAMLLLFPMRTWQRVRSAAATLVAAPAVAASARAPDASTADRLASMHEALRQIARHPLLGLGYGRALYLGVPALGPGPVAPQQPFRGAQNMFLTVWASTGPVGLLLLLAAALAPLRLLDRARRHRAAPVLAGYGGLLVACLAQEALWNTRLLALAIMLTAGAGLGWVSQP